MGAGEVRRDVLEELAVQSVCSGELATTHHSFRGSLSAVSKPILASKYAFFSIFRDLQDLHTFAPLESQVENYLEKNLPENPNFEENSATKCGTETPESPKHTPQDERCTVTDHCRSELLEVVRWDCMRKRLHTANKRL